jgi:NADP-dependent 3-hydroxy acid dehydrogenase YdfG
MKRYVGYGSDGCKALVTGARFCVICPGGIDTEFLDHCSRPPNNEERARLLRAEDVARAIYFVAMQPAHVRIEQLVMTPFPSDGV